MESKSPINLAAWIESTIKTFIQSPDNSLHNESSEPAWAEPLVGYSRGDDPLYETIQEAIGPFYWTPLDLFRRAHPRLSITPDQLTVISWILPQTEATKSDNRKESQYPSERWLRSRKFGANFNLQLRTAMKTLLTEAGYEAAIAPPSSPLWGLQPSTPFAISTPWSERHAAYVSGLGTFGLCDGLITSVGKAIRCGSVVARISIPPTPRSYRGIYDYCLHFSQGACGSCIARCPVGAITENGHDKVKCYRYLDEVTSRYAKDRYALEVYGCGLCQTKVPCESRIPGIPERTEPNR